MNELVQIWRDQKSHVHTLTEVQTPYEGGPYYKASTEPVGAVNYGEIVTMYNYADNKTVAWESPEFEDYKTMENGNFKPLGGHLGAEFQNGGRFVIDDYSRGECTLGQYWRWECKSTYSEDNTLEANSAKSFAQHVQDEIRARVANWEQNAINLTQNFVIREHSYNGTVTKFMGVRVTKDNTELLNKAGSPIKTLMAGDWVFFNFGVSATYGNTKKTHMGVWAICDAASVNDITKPLQSWSTTLNKFVTTNPQSGEYMYVKTGMGTEQYTGNWEDLNIATMPVNGMSETDAKWGQTGL